VRQLLSTAVKHQAVPLDEFLGGLPRIAQESQVVGDKLGRRVDFMGDTGGELADTFQLLSVTQLAFKLASFGDLPGEAEAVLLAIEL